MESFLPQSDGVQPCLFPPSNVRLEITLHFDESCSLTGHGYAIYEQDNDNLLALEVPALAGYRDELREIALFTRGALKALYALMEPFPP